jgi:hypothetical protein
MTRTKIVSTKLLFEQFIAMDETEATFDLRFRRESLTTFAHRFKRRPGRPGWLRDHAAWDTSSRKENRKDDNHSKDTTLDIEHRFA